MRTFLIFFKTNGLIILILILVTIVTLAIPYFLKFENPIYNIRLWYFACLLNYTVILNTIIQKINKRNVFLFLGKFVSVLLVINIIVLLILFLGYFLHPSPFFPAIINTIFAGWPGVISFMVFICLTMKGYFTLKDNKIVS